ncbi:MAG: hypothetical protein ACE5JI_01630, partial [Acidobacteriota bacterium]
MSPEIREVVRLRPGAKTAGLTLVSLLGGVCLLASCSSEKVVIFTLVEAEDEGEGGNPAEPSELEPYRHRSRILALDLRRPDGKPRILTHGFFSAASPALSYDGGSVVFAGKRARAEPWQIWEMRVDGSRLRQVTREARECTDPYYLPDRGIIFSGAVVDGRGGDARVRSLFTCHRDGSQVKRITFGQARDTKPMVMNDGRVLFLRQRPGSGREGTGAAARWMTVHPDGSGIAPFRGPAPSRDGSATQSLIVSRLAAGETYGLFKLNPSAGQGGHALYHQPGFHAVGPILAGPRPVPETLTSVVDETKKSGWLLCLNAYVSEMGEIQRLKPGAIRRLRVFEMAGASGHRVLGEAPVERDGSFYLEVPADRPLGLSLLGVGGEALADFAGGLWVRPNEHRGCIGCHE